MINYKNSHLYILDPSIKSRKVYNDQLQKFTPEPLLVLLRLFSHYSYSENTYSYRKKLNNINNKKFLK